MTDNSRKILIAGGSGMIGMALIESILSKGDFQVTALSRRPRQSHHPSLSWGVLPDSRENLSRLMEQSEVVVNLAGEPLASACWTRKKKRLLRDSRVDFTKRLCQGVLDGRNRPRL